MRWLAIVAVLFFSMCLSNDKAILNVLNWTGYMQPAIIAEFQKMTGIKVNYNMFESDGSLYTKLSLQSGAYDVVGPSSFMIAQMSQQGMLQTLDKDRLAYYKDLNPMLTHNPADPNGDYCIPNFWGTAGIVINRKYFDPKSISSWDDLWQKRFRGKLLIPYDPREVFNFTLISLGYSPNDEDPEHIKQAYLKLKKLLPNIKIFNEAGEETLFTDDDVIAGVSLSGDAFHAQESNPDIAYIYPKEGVAIWLDCLAIPKNPPHLSNAYTFLNFIMRPEISAEIANFAGFATGNLTAIKLLPPDMRASKTLYPDPSVMEHAVVENKQDVKIRMLIEHYWELLKLEA